MQNNNNNNNNNNCIYYKGHADSYEQAQRICMTFLSVKLF